MLEVSVRHRAGAFSLEAAFAAPGGVTALFGRSGAGKTTLLNLVAGIARPAAGRIAVDGAALFDSDRRVDLPVHRRRIGYVFQDARLFPHLSVRGNLLYGARRHGGASGNDGGGNDGGGGDVGANLDRLVDLLDIGPLLGRRPGALSGGERQRVAFGRALLSGPRLLLMDEPLAALDGARRAEMLPYIERLRDETGIGILYVSHTVDEVTRLADRVVLLDGGTVAAAGAVDDIMGRPELMALAGRGGGGAVLRGRIRGAAGPDDLVRLDLADGGGTLFVPDAGFRPGMAVRLRVRARDVALARSRPTDLSIANVLPVTVEAVEMAEGHVVTVRLRAGGQALYAQVTPAAAARFGLSGGLSGGQSLFALVDPVALDPPTVEPRARSESAAGVLSSTDPAADRKRETPD